MSDAEVMRWPWWMAPARLIGRFRPALLAAARADAIVLGRLPRVATAVALPLMVFVLAGVVSATHAFAQLQDPSTQIDWLRFHVDDVFTESPVFILGAIIMGIFSPALGVLLVAVFGVMDLAAAALQPYELSPFPRALAGRLVAIWLLWLLVVEVPVLGRVLASSARGLGRSRLGVAALSAVVTGAFTFLWTQAAAVLLRPVFTWSSLPSGVRVEAIQPIQVGGMVFALVAAAMATTVVLLRGSGRLLHPGAPTRPAERPRSIAVAVVRRLIVATLLTIGLGGIISTPLDTAVLFLALAGAQPLARLIAQRTAIGTVLPRLPPLVRVALAVVLVFGVAVVTVGGPLQGVSEFFSVIAAVAVGLFVIELVLVPRSERPGPRPSVARGAVLGSGLALALMAIASAAPLPVLADNCANFTDCWSTVAAAVLASVAVSTFMAMGAFNWFSDQLLGPPPPPDPPPLTWDDRSPSERQRSDRFRAKDTYQEETDDGFRRTHDEED